ncbi:MAG: glycosyltransferase [Synergistetes bacterium]|nr:glycosyltransferase [Synergistota bacterium]
MYFLINSLAGGGAEKVVVNLMKVFPVSKVFLLEKDVKYQVPEEKMFFLSNHTNKTSPLWKSLFIPIYSLRLAKNLSDQDLVLSMLERANYVNIVSSFFSKHKAVVSVRMSQIFGRPKWHPYNILSRLLYPKAHLLVCVSRGIAKELEFHYSVPREKIRVIYNPIYFDEISLGVREDLGEHCGIFSYPVLITVGRLTKQKGQWYLLRIFKALKCDFPDLKLVILGDGELKDYLVKLSEELNLRTYLWDRDELSSGFDVYFLGFHRNPFKFVSNSTLFLFPSLWEGLPNVLVEALACGVPVISSDCRSGPREVLAPDTDFEYQTEVPEFADYGVLMPVFDGSFKGASEPLDDKERMWVDVVKKLLLDEGLRKGYSQKGKERAKDFDIKVIAKKWQEVLGDYL